MRTILQRHSLGICLALALIIALVLSLHAILAPLRPSVDGQGYAQRAFALYGFLHTGQWGAFVRLLGEPVQSVCALHYLPFFILPQFLAGIAGYTIAQYGVTYFLLAWAVSRLCRILERPAWAPAIFLLCAVNNLALTNVYAFYLDMEFFAAGLLVISWQLGAWLAPGMRHSLLSGVGLGLLFWIKPANALIFSATFFLSELFHAADFFFAGKETTPRRARARQLLRHGCGLLLGFALFLLPALACGAAQSILQIIDANEVHGVEFPVDCHGLLRLFYFPLCLAYYYHILLLAALAGLGLIVCHQLLPSENQKASFLIRLFLPVVFAYLAFGEFFSFGMHGKAMRSLLLMLPLIWILLHWLVEKLRLRSEAFLFAATAYTFVALGQKGFNFLGTESPLAENTYQLSLASWTELPAPWDTDFSPNLFICDQLSAHPPPPGVICVNSIELQKQLTWRLTADDLLQGRPPRYEIRNIFNFKSEYFESTFVGARLIVLKTIGFFAYMEGIRMESNAITAYAENTWLLKENIVQMGSLFSETKGHIGYVIFFPQPLTQTQVDKLNTTPPFSLMDKSPGNGASPLAGPHYSPAEARQLLWAWLGQITGRAP